MKKYQTIIIGGGAAGITAAIACARQGTSVIICERLERIGKKLLVTGNGRCNLLNENISEAKYNKSSNKIVKSILSRVGKREILEYFRNLGLETYSQEGRIFPQTNQSGTVLKVLELELKRLSIPVQYGFTCNTISLSNNEIIISSEEGNKFRCDRVILCGGGKTFPSLGSNGSIYDIARRFGHTIIEPVPVAVPLVVKDNLCFLLQGQRIKARVKSVIQGTSKEEVTGELLFTKYGLSGTCILDISDEISIAINRDHKRDVYIAVDMVPFMGEEQLKNELERRIKKHWNLGEMLAGILPNKFGPAMSTLFENDQINLAAEKLKNWSFKVSGTRGWNEAEFTSGGIKTDEINPWNLESKLVNNVFFAGEVLDVNGQRGGYNLAWAWASGLVSGNPTSILPS